MKKLLLAFSSLIITLNTLIGQEVRTKDGVSLGKKSEFISSCSKGAKESININGVDFDTYKYCSCMCDNLIPTLYSSEIETAAKNNQLMELFLENKNLKVLMSCLEGNVKINDSVKLENMNNLEVVRDNKEIVQKTQISSCISEFLSNPEYSKTLTEAEVEKYCTCATSMLFSRGYTYKDMKEIQNENSIMYNEILLPCLNEIFKDKTEYSSLNSYYPNDIIGSNYSISIPIIDYLGQGYKIKITMNGIEKYYLFDTGATDLIIDQEMEQAMLLNGTLKKENYLEKTYYVLANNEKVTAQLVKINGIVIGDYVVNNVVIAIIDNGSLLCGKSFLDKFRKWELNKEKKILILYK